MTLDEYQALARRTLGDRPQEMQLSNAALGLSGEAGEVADMLKKHLFHSHPLDRDAMVKELGDCLWYVAAMATALPCVATRVGGVPEVVEDGETGLLANPGDDIQLARHVLRLAANAPLREQLGRAARFRAVNKFDESSMHRAYRAIYRQMMSQ